MHIPTPPSAPLLPVPPSFLGLSHEPLTAAAPILRDPTYRRLLSLLASFRTGPFILRWGGSKQVPGGHPGRGWARTGPEPSDDAVVRYLPVWAAVSSGFSVTSHGRARAR